MIRIIDKEQYENIQLVNIINGISKKFYPNKYPMHWHKYVEIIALPESAIGACAILNVNGQAYQLTPGDLLFVWPGELHEIVDNQCKQLIALQFSLNIISEIHEFSLYINLFRSTHLLSAGKTPELVAKLVHSIRKMMSLQKETRPFVQVEIMIILYEMFMTFGTYLLEHNDSYVLQQNKILEKMQVACSYIQENCESDLTLEQVANYIGFSPCYFSRCFKKATTYNYVKYLMLHRVKRAQILLTDTSISITDAAYQAGFKSLSTFNRVFHAYSGCSPSDYRNYYSVD